MKRSLKIKYIAGIVIGLACLIAVHVTCAYLFAVKRITYHLDPLLHATVQHNLVAILDHTLEPHHYHYADAVLELLKPEFPCVKAVATHLVAPGILTIEIIAHKPQLALNKTLVLTEEGTILSKAVFTPQSLCALSAFEMKNSGDVEKVSEPLQCCAPYMRQELCKNYEIVWHSDVEAWLVDKEQPDFAIVCDATTMKNATLIESCQQLKSTLRAQGVFGNKPKKQWVADIRFNKQIILSWKKGEAYGKAIF